ncbi:translation elongation factor 2 (EF-2/EF-G) [Candidatus Magnetobacterium bavaricum]|uniref:Elongation factor G n=1 Tax=Candidatus Magnetobacterium bavaricum TaxID=29290 RepID=A0A0F3H0Y2_9BACT|nr:translation elongation factor 2 (EF-2/EF-G) [Candidatus Magnetobacterium bavaricum]
MASVDAEKIRNIALLAHSGAGKTTLTEAIVFNSGAITRMGNVADGNTVTDFDQEEIERKQSISSALAHCQWRGGYVLNFIDTPGFINFLEDTRGCLTVADGAVVIVSAVSGVRAETMKVWSMAAEFSIPVVVFINEVNKENADFQATLQQIRDSFNINPITLFRPLSDSAPMEGIIDVIRQKAYKRTTDNNYEEIEISSSLEGFRRDLIECVAESDDALLEKYLEGTDLSEEEILNGLIDGVYRRKFIPVTFGSAVNNYGIQQLVDTIIQCLPSPLKRAGIKPIVATLPDSDTEVTLQPLKDKPLAAYVFKTIADPYAGKLTMFRVFSGQLKPDTTVYNATKGVRERIGHVHYLLGKKQIPAQVLGPGEFGVVTKLKETLTGDTLCEEAHPIVFTPLRFAEPIISYAIEPKTKGDEDKVSTGLHKILDEDPTLRFHRDEETNEMIIAGMGQIHIEVSLHKLKRKFGVEVEMKTPKVPCRETIRTKAKAQGKYKKQSGGRGQYGDCWIEIEPLPSGGGFEFVDKVVGGSVPRQYIPAVEKGIVDKLKEGILAGYPMVDIRVTIFDGSYHAVDSSEMAFKIAGSMAIKKAVMDAHPVLMEPIMNVEVITPDDCLGAVIGDLNSKRGKVHGVESQTGGNQKVSAAVPMSEILTYANQLHSITSGRGLYSMEFAHYEDVPAHISQKIIAERSKKDTEE